MDKIILYSPHWYEQRIYMGVLKYAQEHQWEVLSSHHMPSAVIHAPNVDGQIVSIGPRDRRRLKWTQEFDGPVVGLEDFGDGLPIPRVHPDNRAVGKMAARHLLDRGFRRFATVCRVPHENALNRLEGFHREIEGANAEDCVDIQLRGERQNTSVSPRERDARRLMNLRRPVGLFCVSDEDAWATIRYLTGAQVAVPEEIAVVGVNNDPLVCPYAAVPISSVDLGFENNGYQAAQLLDRMMRGKTVEAKVHTIAPQGVVTRRSSDIRAVDDVLVARALRYIWDHAESCVSVGDIATALGLPVRTLQWKFSKQMGHPLQEELTKSRVDRIKHQLLHTTKSTSQIAEDLNFSSVQYMIRVFRKEAGLSPLRYRNLHQQTSR